MIQIQGISKSFGRTLALDDVTLQVPAGSSMALLGRNGAGKTTLAKVVLGLVMPDSGTAAIGTVPVSDPASRRDVGYLPENVVFHAWARPMQLFAQLERVRRSSTARDFRERAAQMACDHLLNRPMGRMSRGQRQRIALALCTCGSPGVLILDEPSSGLDPEGRVHLRSLIRELSAGGATLLLNSHLLGEVESVCRRAAFIREGRLVGEGVLEQLSRTRGEVEVSTARPAALSEALCAGGLDAFAEEGSPTVTVRLGPDAPNLRQVTEAVLESGEDFDGISLRRENLEDIFMRMMKEDDPVSEHP